MNGKTMPHNLESEQAVLGSMFISKYALQKCVESLTGDLFFLDSHNKIFTVIADLSETGTIIDFTTVTAELDKRNWLILVGNVEYLTEITNKVASAANIDAYIKIVLENATLRRLIEEATEIVTSAYSGADSLNEVLDNAERKILNVVKTRKGTEFRTIQDVLFKAQSDLEKLAQKKGEITGLPTGFYDLDKLTSGLHPNELTIIAARPGMGKTAFALNLACHVAINTDETVAVFNMEMGAEQLAMRMLASLGQIDGNKMRTGRLEHNDWKRVNEAISRLADTKLFIDDTPGMTIGEIRAKCRRLASTNNGLGLIVIDYLQLINGSAKYAGNRQMEISEISRSLKTLAMELEVPVIALSQLSRSVEGRENKRPLLSDLRESGSIEQDADVVSFLYRDDYYNKEAVIDEHTSKSEYIIGKHRNGPTATIDLMFIKNTSTFRNYVNELEK
ncbi:MAG: replicative DNA helicase [Bacilli bacterium]|nr:replicative DNA helicase [Bacilli bacterium]MDD4282327.1 replicative DNA helicase [Bacilli bacterium]MDD4718331.1 replicative DNA helicase [Bacilli bacterium]